MNPIVASTISVITVGVLIMGVITVVTRYCFQFVTCLQFLTNPLIESSVLTRMG